MNGAKLLARLEAWVPQPLTAVIASLLAVTAWLWAWAAMPHTPPRLGQIQTSLVVTLLVAALVWTDTHPIHLRRQIKVHLTTLPLYLMAVLLPPPLAALACGLGILIAQWRMRPQTGNLPSDIATAISRWVVIILLASPIAQLPSREPLLQAISLCGAAALMFVLDVITIAFEVAPMSGEPPVSIMRATLQEGGLYEGAQYVTAVLAASAALHHTWTLVLLVVPTYIVYVTFKNAKETHDSTFQLLESLADAVDLRDPYTGGHSRRVAEWSAEILREMNVHGPEADLTKAAARVHDIGKIGVPDHILNKPEKLTSEEKRAMDSHPVHGAELLARFPDFARGQGIVRHHHERWDGLGYPDRLQSWDIPFGARVIAVADSFDAMTSDRPYRAGMSIRQVVHILREGRGQQWDPAVVDAFLHYLDRTQESGAGLAGAVQHEEAVVTAVSVRTPSAPELKLRTASLAPDRRESVRP